MEVLVERLTARQRCMNLSYWGFYKAISSVVIAQLMECEILNMVFGLCCLTAPWKMTTTRKTGLIVNLRLLNFPFRSSHTQLQQIGPKVQQDSQSAFVASTSLLPHNTPTTSNPTRDRWSVPRALQASNDKRSAIQTYIREQKSLIWPKSFSDRQCLKHLFPRLKEAAFDICHTVTVGAMKILNSFSPYAIGLMRIHTAVLSFFVPTTHIWQDFCPFLLL